MVVAFVVPPGILVPLAFEPDVAPAVRDLLFGWLPEPFWLGFVLLGMLVAGTWWLGLGLALARFRRAVRWTFWPFADWFERWHGMRIAMIGLIIAAVSSAALVAVLQLGR